MTDLPENATFSIERDGREYDVDVARAVAEQAVGPDRLDAETMAEWLQNNLDALSDIARAKLDRLDPSASRVTITPDDWAGT